MRSKYRTIVADPPWDHSDGTGVNFRSGRVTHLPYGVMSTPAIQLLPVSEISSAGAHLYLWTTRRFLHAAYAVAESWGFSPSAVLVWCKEPRGFGMGGKFRNNLEFNLFCRDFAGVGRISSYLADAAELHGVSRKEVDREMGTSDMAGWWLSRLPHRSKCPLPEQYQRLKAIVGAGDAMDAEVAGWNEHKGEEPTSDTSWFRWPRGEHSAKPDAFLDLVESVSPGPYLELFARRQRLGWDTWGNEALEHVSLEAV